MTTDNIILRTVYNQALNDCNQGQNNWVKKVKRILSEYGFSHVFDNQCNTNYSIFINVFKQRVIDCFQQGWSGSVNESSVLIIYKEFKVSSFFFNSKTLFNDGDPVSSQLWVRTLFRLASKPLKISRLQIAVVYTSIANANRSLCKKSNSSKWTILSFLRNKRHWWWISFYMRLSESKPYPKTLHQVVCCYVFSC